MALQRAAVPHRRLSVRDVGQVIVHGEEQYSDQLGARDVWVFKHEGTYFAHYDAAGSTGWLAALATSDDGITWTKHGPILELGAAGEPDSASASYGTVYRDGDRWHMFYLGTPNVTPDDLKTPSFPYATLKATADSPYGPWRKQPGLRPFSPKPGTYYSETASPGAILRVDDRYLMIFSAAQTHEDGSIWRTLGTAWTTDLDGEWEVSDQPLLPETEQIENSSLYFDVDKSLWYLFTNHIAVDPAASAVPPQGTAEYTDAVWVYWSPSPTSFSPENKAIALDVATSKWSRKVIGLPSVVRVGNSLGLYYDGSVVDGISHGGRDVGLALLDLPLEPRANS